LHLRPESLDINELMTVIFGLWISFDVYFFDFGFLFVFFLDFLLLI